MLIGNSFLALVATVTASTTALEAATALDLAAGLDGDDAGPPATAAALGWRRPPTPYAARDSASSPHTNADLGALTLQQRQATGHCPDSCPPGFFGYCYGASIGPETCGEDCCTGYYACSLFTGCVKNDGSCASYEACYNAKAPIIENSCKGQSACYSLGYNDSVGAVIDSCNGYSACADSGYYDTMGLITQSCNGHKACIFMGHYSMGRVTKSCNSEEACRYLYSVKSITKTCNNAEYKPCAILAYLNEDFGHLTKFLHAEIGKKYTRDSIGSIHDCQEACVNDINCNGIKWKGHAPKPCRFFGGPISKDTCGGKSVCITVE